VRAANPSLADSVTTRPPSLTARTAINASLTSVTVPPARLVGYASVWLLVCQSLVVGMDGGQTGLRFIA
jgi:hypothetical protein